MSFWICYVLITSVIYKLSYKNVLIVSLSQWYFKNRLTVNAGKCKMMILRTRARLQIASIDDFTVMYEINPLDLMEKTKYLGLHLSADLNWDTHIMKLYKHMKYY